MSNPAISPKANILVIDDTPENLYLLSSMLTERGYKVRSVTKGSDGLRGAQAAPPDLILLDVRMPEMDGYEVCQQLQQHERTKEIPVIFISASGEVLDKVQAFGVGGVDYITKPFQVEEVLARIETHLMLRRLHAQLEAQNAQLETQNAQLQQEIRERAAAEEKFAKAFRASPSPIAILTLAEQRFIEVNPSFLRMSSYTETEILNRTIVELKLVTANTYEQIVQLFQEKGVLQNQELEICTKHNEIRTVLLSIEQIELAGIPCILNIINDITEYKRLENEFISLVSHELRTPLNSLIGSLDLLRTGKLGSLSEKGQQVLDIAISNSVRLIRLVNDILDLERIKLGKITMQKVQCQAESLLAEAIEAMQSMAEQAKVVLKGEAIAAEFWADPDRLLQMLTNLLSNAIKFSEPKQTVWLRACVQSDQLHIQVADQGRGIPTDQLQRIFEPFQQVDASDSREKGGTGLGLAICRSIVEQHQGQIWVESSLGEGSTFHILLPLRMDE
ncbi:MAG: response regulator [Elainella sp. C42_A2020_010]|nr:response regulator [Elainella sp. C42_A2020_010]RNJ65966.1 MAG: hybrid sensor histidine kinase/response regulator [Leptolyngbya sp. IPPAS B-1204]